MLATFALAFLPAPLPAQAAAAPQEPAAARSLAAAEFLPGRIAFKLRSGAELDSARIGLAEPAQALFLPIPATRVDSVGLARWRTLETPVGLEEAFLAMLEQRPEIERAERLGLGQAITNTPPQPPNDPFFSTQWVLQQANDIDMDVPEAWTLRGSYSADPSLLVGVVDTGYDSLFSAPDFQNAIWTNPLELANGLDDDGNGLIDDLHGYDFVNNDANPYADHPHGTLVSSVIAARSDNGSAIAGIASGVRCVYAKSFDATGNFACCGPWAGTASAAVGLQYCVNAHCDLINNSWVTLMGFSAVVQDAVQYALDNDVHLVFGAGNGNINAQWPSQTEGVIAVAGLDSAGHRSVWCCGQASNFGPWVDLAGGGTAVPCIGNNGVATTADGTSLATPCVSGVAALVLSKDRDLSTEDLLAVLKLGAVSVDALNPGFAGQLGAGLVNAYASLRLLEPVADLGGGLAGASVPKLNAWGAFGAGKQFTFSTSHASAGAPGALVLGFSALNLPLFGGVLVPSPDLVYAFVASAKGAKAQIFSFAAALPAGLVVHAQAATLDAGAAQGIALSNAVRVTVP